MLTLLVQMLLALTFLERLALNKRVLRFLVWKPAGWISGSVTGVKLLVWKLVSVMVAILLPAVYVCCTVAMFDCGMNNPIVLYLFLKLKVVFENVMWFGLLETAILKNADILLMFLSVNF